MPRVKSPAAAVRPPRGGTGTRVSSKRQVTLPKAEMEKAGLDAGAVVRVEAIGPGQLMVTRLDEVIARYSGAVATGGAGRRALAALRDEWA
jgi:bifunctional DNA-binding transcriptional regulator/antitoxin component of YhaV-PrlF toxin-antitoxin module